jgi:hypothetical protein
MHTFFITTTQSTMSLTERIMFELLLWPGIKIDFFSFLPLSAISFSSEASLFLYSRPHFNISGTSSFLSTTFLFISRTCFSAGKPTRFETGAGLTSRRQLKRRNYLQYMKLMQETQNLPHVSLKHIY